MNLKNITVDIKQEPLPAEEIARMQTAWASLRYIWERPMTATFTFEPAPEPEEANTVEGTVTVLPLPGEESAGLHPERQS